MLTAHLEQVHGTVVRVILRNEGSDLAGVWPHHFHADRLAFDAFVFQNECAYTGRLIKQDASDQLSMVKPGEQIDTEINLSDFYAHPNGSLFYRAMVAHEPERNVYLTASNAITLEL